MEYNDFFYKKLREVFNTLTPRQLETFVMEHPRVANCTIVTYDELDEMEKVLGRSRPDFFQADKSQ